jgi:hypothetical protein
MDKPADSSKGPPPRFRAFDDPHYHDDSDFDAGGAERDVDYARPKKPVVRDLPPPRRYED